MNRTDAPKKQAVPFALNGQRETILDVTPAGDNTASYSDGFPPVTMILKSAGGLPPKGQDMNQILFELSALGRWFSTGAQQTFDAAFASSIGGYPSGAYVIGDDLKTLYRCTTNGNSNNPNSSTTGWVKVANDIADILSLGTAAYRNVGTGTNQIPDISSFTYTTTGSGVVIRLPGNMIIQMDAGITDANGYYEVNMGVAMSSYRVFAVEGLVSGWQASGGLYSFLTVYGTEQINSNKFKVRSASWRSSDKNFIAQSTVFYWIAIGRA